MEQQSTINNHTFVLLNFRSIIVATPIYLYIYIFNIDMHVKLVRACMKMRETYVPCSPEDWILKMHALHIPQITTKIHFLG